MSTFGWYRTVGDRFVVEYAVDTVEGVDGESKWSGGFGGGVLGTNGVELESIRALLKASKSFEGRGGATGGP